MNSLTSVLLLLLFATVATPTPILDNGVAPPEIIQTINPAAFKPRCKITSAPLDLTFVFDASGSLREEFGEDVQIMKDIVNTVAVGLDNTRIQIILYAGFARVELRFNQSVSKDSVLKTIDTLTNTKGITNTGVAMQMALDEMSSYDKGMRSFEVPKMIFLISDGRSHDWPKDIDVGKAIRAKNIQTYAYGTGQYVAMEDLVNVTGAPDHVWSHANYSSMLKFFETWKGTETCESAPVCIAGSDKPLDLLFVVDGSGSLKEDFPNESKFVLRVLKPLNVHIKSTRVALIQYAANPKVEFGFGQYKNSKDAELGVRGIQYRSGTTSTDLALARAKYLLETDPDVRPSSVPKVVIVMTDGHSQTDPTPMARELIATGAVVFAVSVNPVERTFEGELLNISGGNPKRVFTQRNLNQFENEFKKYIGSPCPGYDEYAGNTEPIVRNPIETTCTSNSVTVKVRTLYPFEGRLYAAGYNKISGETFYNDQSCYVIGDNSNSEVSITLYPGYCNIRKTATDYSPPGYNFEGAVTIQFHPQLLTQTDLTIPINCFYETNEALQKVGQLIYSLSRYDPNGCTMLDGIIGEYVIHNWRCDDLEPGYDFLVRSCYAESDKGERVQYIDDYGCSVDKYVLETPTYDRKSKLAYKEGYLFRFPTSRHVTFKCKISACDNSNGDCDGITPPVSCAKPLIRSLRRRSTLERNNVVTTTLPPKRLGRYMKELDVEAKINVLDNESVRPTKPIQYCSTLLA